jgi:hypothetical protein
MGAFRFEYSRFILKGVAVPRRLYLVIFSLLIVALAAAGLYWRQRANAARDAAACDTPAPPPPPAAPPPKLPGFELEAGCGAGGPAAPAKTAPAKNPPAPAR